MPKKMAQSAMEFLMTYGWALLIMVIIIAVLFYLGILQPKTPNSLIFSPGFSASSFRVGNGTGAFELDFGHAKGQTIRVTKAGCSMQEIPALTQSLTNLTNPVVIPSGTHKWIIGGDSGNTLNCLDENGNSLNPSNAEVGQRYRGKVCIEYEEVESGLTRQVCGDLNARFESGVSGGAGGCDSDSVCDAGESCACSDCEGQEDGCGVGLVCVNGSCGTPSPPPGQGSVPNGGSCTNDYQCQSMHCSQNICCQNVICCTQDSDCPNGYTCSSNSCSLVSCPFSYSGENTLDNGEFSGSIAGWAMWLWPGNCGGGGQPGLPHLPVNCGGSPKRGAPPPDIMYSSIDGGVLRMNNSIAGSDGNSGIAWQPVDYNLTGKSSAVLSFNYKVEQEDFLNATSYWVKWVDAEGTCHELWRKYSGYTVGSWQTFSENLSSVLSPAPARLLELGVGVYDGYNYIVYFDNVTLTVN